MHVRVGFDIRFTLPCPTAIIALLHVHPSRQGDLLLPDVLHTEPNVHVSTYLDSFGNRCSRIFAPAGELRLFNTTEILCVDTKDEVDESAPEVPVQDLPSDVLRYLLSSRYCEVDRMSALANDLFGHLPPGYTRVQAIVAYVYSIVEFGYFYARPTKTALDVFTERQGVCRDFQHLAITLCRALNIPARYATGYLGDFDVPPSASPMDFSAWFEAYLGGRWFTFDARHNKPRLGRVLMATGRDATDVALTTSFGTTILKQFTVISDWIDEHHPANNAERNA